MEVSYISVFFIVEGVDGSFLYSSLEVDGVGRRVFRDVSSVWVAVRLGVAVVFGLWVGMVVTKIGEFFRSLILVVGF